jgi:hypothetical protein
LELDRQPLGDRVEVRVGFVELHSGRRVGAIHFHRELVDAATQLPNLSAENGQAGDHHDEHGDTDEAEAVDDNLRLPELRSRHARSSPSRLLKRRLGHGRPRDENDEQTQRACRSLSSSH